MSHTLERDRQAQWAVRREQGAPSRQQNRQWAAKTVRWRLNEEEFAAAQRLVRECQGAFEGASVSSGERVDCGNAAAAALDYRVDACRRLEMAKIAVSLRSDLPGCHRCLESLARGESLADVARAIGYWRKRRDRVSPNTDMASNAVQIVLEALAAFYADNTLRAGFSVAA